MSTSWEWLLNDIPISEWVAFPGGKKSFTFCKWSITIVNGFNWESFQSYTQCLIKNKMTNLGANKAFTEQEPYLIILQNQLS